MDIWKYEELLFDYKKNCCVYEMIINLTDIFQQFDGFLNNSTFLYKKKLEWWLEYKLAPLQQNYR